MSIIKKLDKHFWENRYFYLLASTMMLVFLSSFFPNTHFFINEVTLSLFMLANINFIRHNKRIILIMILFAVVSILLAWVPNDLSLGLKFLATERVILILFISVIISLIISQILKSKVVSVNLILGVITIYILFGLMAGDINQLILYYDSNAFSGNIDINEIADLRYFSYVTVTTLGYGDISPASPIARAVAVFFSLVGQIYLAVVIAVIVGKYVSHSDKTE